MGTVGWGVIGCSDIVKRRAGAAIAQQPDSTLVAFHSRDRKRAAAFASEFGALDAYDDLDAMLADDRIQVVYIATEVDRHAPQAIAAARAGKHVLLEKPMALDVAECRAAITAANEAGVHLSVAYYARFYDKALAIKRVIDDGDLGQVVRAHVRIIGRYDPAPDDPKFWRVTGRGGGNQIADGGSHRLDMVSYWLGRPAKVYGFADRLSMAYDAADTETALVQMASGAHVTVIANANVPVATAPAQRGAGPQNVGTSGPANGGPTNIELYGTKGTLLTDPWMDGPVEVFTRDGLSRPAIETKRPDNAHSPMIDEFAAAIAAGRAPRFNGLDGMWATTIIAGVYESASTGRVVEIPDH